MDYKKIFNEANLEKQEESKMRLNECGSSSYGGCGYYSPSIYTSSEIFEWLENEKEFWNVDRKYMKSWCYRNGDYIRSKSDAIVRFRKSCKDKKEREEKDAVRKAAHQALIDVFEVTEEQIEAAKSALSLNREIQINKEVLEDSKKRLETSQKRLEDSIAKQEKTWEKAGGKELWEDIISKGFKIV